MCSDMKIIQASADSDVHLSSWVHLRSTHHDVDVFAIRGTDLSKFADTIEDMKYWLEVG